MSTACALVLVSMLTAAPSPSAPRREAEVDLDGDGRRERVTLELPKPGAFQLRAGKALVEGTLPGAKGFTVVDLDSGDKRREVLVHGESDGAARFLLFRHTGGAFQEVPLPPGSPSASGNGILLSDVPMAHGWARRDKYLYDAKTPRFTEVPQELYAVGRVVARSRSVVLRRTPGGEDVVVVAGVGRSLSLLAFKPDASARGGGWYLTGVVDAPGDMLGWLLASELQPATPDAVSDASPQAQTAPTDPELYASGLKAKVATSFPLLFTRRAEAETVARVRAESTVTLLATDGAWYLVLSETGLLGWARPGTIAENMSVKGKGGAPDTRAQLSALQLRLLEVAPKSPNTPGRWLPASAGLILENEYASTLDTYHFCPDGRVVLEFLVDEHKKYGTWVLDGDTLKLTFTRATKQIGMGAPLPGPPEGQEGLRQYSEYSSHEGEISESVSLSWSEVLEGAKGSQPGFMVQRGTPTCR